MANYIVGVTGASGSIYADRLIRSLLKMGHGVDMVVSATGLQVMAYELQLQISAPGKFFPKHYDSAQLVCHQHDNYFSPIASGSRRYAAMIVIPCSMGACARIRNGISSNLLERAADVTIKEGRKLVVVPREMPLSLLHLENMLALKKAGAAILPATPAFYHRPTSLSDIVDFVVGRVLDSLGLDHQLYPVWQGDDRQGQAGPKVPLGPTEDEQ